MNVRRCVVMSALLVAGLAASVRGQTQNELVQHRVLPQLEYLFDKLIVEKRDMTIDGQKAFTGGDRFLPGKIALGLSLVLVNTSRTDPDFARYLEGFRDVADMTLHDPNDTWGIYYYMSAIYRLHKAGLLDEAIRPSTLAVLRRQLDWRVFVRVPEYTVIKLPTNYLGVAFSIARLRMLMGWEDAEASERLLGKILEHYERYSGEYGFSDETDGAGRFDRYSVLLIGEIGERLIETGMDVTPEVKRWLRRSADLMLLNLNARGDGFSYGRSIGPYGDTAFLEVLSAAAYFDVLTSEEKEMAYAFATRAVRKYVDFWFDADMRSVNMWEKGRATEQYRNKSRILGENFSIADQLIKTNEVWNRLGFANRPPSPRFDRWLAALPRLTLTWFARGELDRALVTYRDRGHVISLPVISGGPAYHGMNTYFPIPYSHRLVQGSPNAVYPQLLPRFALADGTVLMPLAFAGDIRLAGTTLAFSQPAFNRMGSQAPVPDSRLSSTVRYEFGEGRITRIETYEPAASLQIADITLEFGSFSEAPQVEGTRVRFRSGDVTEFAVEGLDSCEAVPAPPGGPYTSTHGPMKTVVRCRASARTAEKPFTIRWELRYR